MAHYRKIDPRIWRDPRFQQLWADRWAIRSRVPISYPYPFKPLPEREQLCLTRRHYFQKHRKPILAYLIETYGRACFICQRQDALVPDHVIPLCWGGTNDVWNFQILCLSCNSVKSGRLPIVEEPDHARL